MRLEVHCDCGEKFRCSECVIRKDLIEIIRPYIAFGVVDFVKCSIAKKEKKNKK